MLVDSGPPIPSLEEFATINKSKRGKALAQPVRYLERVHVDIAFGDCPSRGGFRYTLIFIDRATRYNWEFGLK